MPMLHPLVREDIKGLPGKDHVKGDDEVPASVPVADLDVLDLGGFAGCVSTVGVLHSFNTDKLKLDALDCRF